MSYCCRCFVTITAVVSTACCCYCCFGPPKRTCVNAHDASLSNIMAGLTSLCVES